MERPRQDNPISIPARDGNIEHLALLGERFKAK
jgi:hypothetical protein